MVTCFFGIPGVGKTTILTQIAVKELNRIRSGKSKYDMVLTNFYCVGCHQIDFTQLSEYKLYNCLILLDEITLDADNRHFKSFPTGARDFFILHRHLHCDIVYATQSFDMVDMKIKNVTGELWYMQKSVIPFFREFTYSKRVYRKVNINEFTADMTNGYRFCNLAETLFTSNFKLTYRKLYYKYFDSFEEGKLADRHILYPTKWSSSDQTLSLVLSERVKLLTKKIRPDNFGTKLFGMSQPKVDEKEG